MTSAPTGNKVQDLSVSPENITPPGIHFLIFKCTASTKDCWKGKTSANQNKLLCFISVAKE